MRAYDETVKQYNAYLTAAQKSLLKARARQLSMANAPERMQQQTGAVRGVRQANELLSSYGLARSLRGPASSGLDERARRTPAFQSRMGALQAYETAQLKQVGNQYAQATIAERRRQEELERRRRAAAARAAAQKRARAEANKALNDAIRGGLGRSAGDAIQKQINAGDYSGASAGISKAYSDASVAYKANVESAAKAFIKQGPERRVGEALQAQLAAGRHESVANQLSYHYEQMQKAAYKRINDAVRAGKIDRQRAEAAYAAARAGQFTTARGALTSAREYQRYMQMPASEYAALVKEARAEVNETQKQTKRRVVKASTGEVRGASAEDLLRLSMAQKKLAELEAFGQYRTQTQNRSQLVKYAALDDAELADLEKQIKADMWWLQGKYTQAASGKARYYDETGRNNERTEKEIERLKAAQAQLALIGQAKTQRALAKREERYAEIQSVTDAADFTFHSTKGAAMVVVSAQGDRERYQAQKDNPHAVVTNDEQALLHALINDRADRVDELRQSIMTADSQGTYARGQMETARQIESAAETVKLMTGYEKAAYNYYMDKGGAKAAKEYMDSITTFLNERRMNQMQEMAAAETRRVPWLGRITRSMATVITSQLNFTGGLYTITKKLSGQEIDPYDPAFTTSMLGQAVRGTVQNDVVKAIYNASGSEALASAIGFGYQTVMGVADNLLSIYLGGAIGSAAGAGAAKGGVALQRTVREAYTLGTMSLASAGDTTRNALLAGATEDQAVRLGIMAGMYEAIFEKISLDNLIDMPKQQLKPWIVRTLTQAGVEASEELATELANTVTNALILGNQGDYDTTVSAYMLEGCGVGEARAKAFIDQIGEIGLAAAGGFFSGGLMGGMYAARGDAQNRAIGKAINAGNTPYGDAKTLLEEARSVDNEKVQRLYAKLHNAYTNNKNLSNLQLGQLNYAIAVSGLDAINAKVDGYVKSGTLSETEGKQLKELFERQATTEAVSGFSEDAPTEAEWADVNQDVLNEILISGAKERGMEPTDRQPRKDLVPRTESKSERMEERNRADRAEAMRDRVGENIEQMRFDRFVETLPMIPASTPEARRQYAEENNITVPDDFIPPPMKGDGDPVAAKAQQNMTAEQLKDGVKRSLQKDGLIVRLHKYDRIEQLTERERDMLLVARAIHAMGAAHVEVHDTLPANGAFIFSTNTIHIALDAESPLGAMAHELTHYIESNAADEFAKLTAYLRQQADNARKDGFETLVQEKMQQYHNPALSAEEMRAIGESEAIAALCEDMLRDEVKIREFIQSDMTLGERVLSFFNDLLRNFKRLLRTDRGGKGAPSMIADIEKARALWFDALAAAKQQQNSAAQRAGTQEVAADARASMWESRRIEPGDDLLHEQIQLPKTEYNRALDAARKKNQQTGDMKKFDNVVVGDICYWYMNFDDAISGTDIPDGMELIFVAKAHVGSIEYKLNMEDAKNGNNERTNRAWLDDREGEVRHEPSGSFSHKQVLQDEGDSDSDNRYAESELGEKRGRASEEGGGDLQPTGRPGYTGRRGGVSNTATQAPQRGASSFDGEDLRESRRSPLPAREAAPALQKAKESIAERPVTREDGLKTTEPAEVITKIACGLHGNKHWGLKDPTRNADAFAGGDAGLRSTLADLIERPFNEAGGIYARSYKARADIFMKAMGDLEIRTKEESAAVMRWGEGYYQEGNRIYPYTLAMLQKQFPDKWQNIQKAAAVCRDIYDGYIDELNAMLEEIYPNLIEHAETRAEKLQEYVDRAEEKARNQRRVIARLEVDIAETVKQIEGKKRTDTQVYANLKNSLADRRARLENAEALLEHYEQRALVRRDQKAAVLESIQSGEVLRNRRVLKRKDYFHHFKETFEGIEQLLRILNENREISPQLAGKSAVTKPKTKWAAFMQPRTGPLRIEDGVTSMLRYMAAAEYKLAFDPLAAHMRGLGNAVRNEAGTELKNANDFIKWANEWSNNLVGKSSSIDRAVSDSGVVGRKAVEIARWINGRVKSNAILANLRTMLIQPANITNATAYMPNPQDWASGARALIEMKYGKDAAAMRSIMDQSSFITQRFMDIPVFGESQYTPKKIALMGMQAGDELAAKYIWWTAYQRYTRNPKAAENVGGMQYRSAVEYADDITRRSVGGRGVGEVPTLLTSQLTNLIAPFQVEVTNTFQSVKERLKKRDWGAIVAFEITTFILNSLMELAFKDRPLPFDLFRAIAEAIKHAADDDEEETLGEEIAYGLRGVSGEIAQGLPFAAQIASMTLSDETSQKWFGQSDPTRYGTGNIGLTTLTDSVADLGSFFGLWMSGKLNSLEEFEQALLARTNILNVALPWGGNQLSRTLKGVDTVARGYSQKLNDDGELQAQFAVDGTAGELLHAAAFGKWVLPEAQAYLDGGKPLNAEKTEEFKAAKKAGIDGKLFFELREQMGDVETVKDAEGNVLKSELSQKVELLLAAGDMTEAQRMIMVQQLGEDSLAEKVAEANVAGVPVDVYLDYYVRHSRMKSIEQPDGKKYSTTQQLRDTLMADKSLSVEQKEAIDRVLIGNEKQADYRSQALYELSTVKETIVITKDNYEAAKRAEKKGVPSDAFWKYTDIRLKTEKTLDENGEVVEEEKIKVLRKIAADSSLSASQKRELERYMYAKKDAEAEYTTKNYDNEYLFRISCLNKQNPTLYVLKAEHALTFGVSYRESTEYAEEYAAERKRQDNKSSLRKVECYDIMENVGIPKQLWSKLYKTMTMKEEDLKKVLDVE